MSVALNNASTESSEHNFAFFKPTFISVAVRKRINEYILAVAYSLCMYIGTVIVGRCS